MLSKARAPPTIINTHTKTGQKVHTLGQTNRPKLTVTLQFGCPRFPNKIPDIPTKSH